MKQEYFLICLSSLKFFVHAHFRLALPGEYGICGDAYNATLTTPFTNEIPPQEQHTFNPAVVGISGSCGDGCSSTSSCIVESSDFRYIWIRLQYDQVNDI
jgi:hypothetical protein